MDAEVSWCGALVASRGGCARRGADEREESGAVVRVELLLFGVTFTIPPFALRASTYPANTATLLSLRDISPNRGITFTQGRQPLSLCGREFCRGVRCERRVVVDNFAFCVAGCVATVLSVNIAWELLFFDVKSSFLRK